MMARSRSIYIASTGSARRRGRAASRPTGSLPARDDLYANGAEPETPPFRERPTVVRLLAFTRRHERVLTLLAAVAVALITVAVSDALRPRVEPVSREALETRLAESFEELAAQPSVAAAAYDRIGPSVVRVRRLGVDPDEDEEQGVGTGVVIVDSGQILTNLHVVAGAERIGIRFADGSESTARIVSAQPENDLAVLEAEIVPEGLPPATLASAAGLRPGDEVIAVGNPFGIGPSVSAGVVSGLARSYSSLDGSVTIDNLIQFDAAANPGNSGGPLVNRRGEVVGIVTSILNPTEDGVFIGIGFAVPIETAAAAIGPNPF